MELVLKVHKVALETKALKAAVEIKAVLEIKVELVNKVVLQAVLKV